MRPVVFAVFAVVGLAFVFTIVRTYPPTQYGWMPSCVFFQMTGWHCPGCGGTRAVTALVHGDFGLAIRSNAMLVVGLPVILAIVRWQRIRVSRGGLASPMTAWVLFVVLSLFFIVRNVPSPSRSPLAPPGVQRSSEQPSIRSGDSFPSW